MSENVITFPEPAGLFSKRGRTVPIESEPQEVVPAKVDWRSRENVQKDIEEHTSAQDRYAKAVAWVAAAEAENLPPATSKRPART
jgi:hypothetical protein